MQVSSLNSNIQNRFMTYPLTLEEATWICETCGVIVGKPVTLFGETRYVKGQCDCQINTLIQKQKERENWLWARSQAITTYSWLGSRWEDTDLASKTFDTFDARKQQEAFETVRMFVMEMKGSLVLHGTFGTGKTHLLAALCNELRGCRKASLFTTAPKLFSAINAYISNHEDYSNLIVKAMRTPLLVIDDIDKAKHSEFREEIYFEIVDERVKRGLPIAISTNRLDELANFVGGAVCSRLKVGQIPVKMIGDDFRETMEA